jgi:HEAT repeat protein
MNNPKCSVDLPDPRNDPRRVEELISAALVAPNDDEDAYWDAIQALQWRGTREVLDQASPLCQSLCSTERRVGAHILGQLGCPGRTFPEECCRILTDLLENEREVSVISAALVALSHHRTPETIGINSRFRHHADADVRFGTVLALMGYEATNAIEPLLELTKDSDAHVRDWATFALGTQVDVDTPELRQALVERLTDEDADARGEAFVGLARRRDRRLLPALQAELASDLVGRLSVEAASLIGDPSLYPLLIDLRGWWDENGDTELLQEAIEACRPDSG